MKTLTKSPKTLNIVFPMDDFGKQVEALAKQEHRSVNAVMKDAFRKYRSQKILQVVMKEGRKLARKNKLTEKDFGGPFAK
jgi:hypothetical protein